MIQTYILDRDIDKIPLLINNEDYWNVLSDTFDIAAITFTMPAWEDPVFQSIPSVVMWQDYAAALLALLTSLWENTPMETGERRDTRAEAALLDGLHAKSWSNWRTGRRTEIKVHNPILSVSDQFILSHKVALACSNPVAYTHFELDDLSIPYATDWNLGKV